MSAPAKPFAGPRLVSSTTPPQEPPHNIDAEQGLLGAILVHGRLAFHHVPPTLFPTHFYVPLNQDIFARAKERFATGEEFNGVTLKAYFPSQKSSKYMMELVANGGMILNVASYANEISMCYYKRRLSELAEKVSSASDSFALQALIADVQITAENLQKTEARAAKQIWASPYKWVDPATIPPRDFIYGRQYIRKFLSCTIAAGGVGKSSLGIAEMLAMVTGRNLLGIEPRNRSRVWYWNGEDPLEELWRRIGAAMLYFGITPDEIEGHLFLDTGRDMPVKLMKLQHGTVVAVPGVKDEILATIKANGIDVLVMDPFVKSHQVTENDSGPIDAVCTEWASIADAGNCCIDLLHHPRKTNGAEVTAEDARGSSALLGAARSARVANTMSKQEADDAGIDERQRWRYFRTDNGKANMAPPADRAEWFKLESQELGNGDNVGVVTSWEWPAAFEGVTTETLLAAQRAVNGGGPWRATSRAKQWVGVPIAEAAGLDLDKPCDRKRVSTMIKVWTQNGMLKEVTRKGDDRHDYQFVEVGKWANDLED